MGQTWTSEWSNIPIKMSTGLGRRRISYLIQIFIWPTQPHTSGLLKTHSSATACETYLGRPLTSLPDPETLNRIIQDVNTIHKKFLQNVVRQTEKGFRMCIAVPAWKTKNGFKHLPTLDHLEELGYNRVSFVHVKTSDLIYHREDQTVARELVVIVRK